MRTRIHIHIYARAVTHTHTHRKHKYKKSLKPDDSTQRREEFAEKLVWRYQI